MVKAKIVRRREMYDQNFHEEAGVVDGLGVTVNTYRTAVSPTLDFLCHEDFNVGRSEAESNIEIFMAQ